MSSIAKSGISLSKKDLTKSRIPLVASRNVTFYHKATVGQLTINLLALTMPSSEMPTSVQATVAEISGAQLAINKKNLNLVSTSKGPLVQGLDYIVTSSTVIVLIGPYTDVGAEISEIFIGSINSAPISDLVVASAKSVVKTYTLAVGQNILNLGLEYQTGQNINDDIGIIKVWVNGVLAIRDTDYAEVDAGSGYGTTINFFTAPPSIPYQVVVDFGVMAITDNNAIGTIESLSGAILKIADDLAVVAGTAATDYLTANPSEIERRGFGDQVLSNKSKLELYDTTETLSDYTKTKYQKNTLLVSQSVFGAVTSLQFNNLTVGKKYRLTGYISYSMVGGVTDTISLSASGALVLSLWNFRWDTSGFTTSGKNCPSAMFEALTSTLSFSFSGNTVSQSLLSGTYMILEELPNHEITTQWT
jgi:hypothetical protein